MKRLIGSILVLGAAMAGVSQTAVAHERSYHHFETPRHLSVVVHRDHHMPRWLRKKKDFRHWYKRSALRRNHALAWWQLYEIYQWETRYPHSHRPAHYASRDYSWYRGYWHTQEHRHRYDRERRRGDHREVRRRDHRRD